MNNFKRGFKKSALALAISSQVWGVGLVYANPEGGEIVGGIGTIEQNDKITQIIQDTQRLAIDWQSFNVGVDEQVNFIQPDQHAVALNRILSANGSEIMGRINANGYVILVNPRGIVFGKDAVVDAGGLIASGLNINANDFINGDLVFKRLEGTEGTVINNGILNAAVGGNIALIGSQVENNGLISANLGTVTLASGNKTILTFDDEGLLGVQIDEAILQEELGEQPAIKNNGKITAQSGRVLLSATTSKKVFDQVVNDGGVKQARSVVYNDDGSFDLTAGGDVVNTGDIDVSGQDTSGDVVVLGENINNSAAIMANFNA
jgi:filamentous hemagglutinin family protein